MKVKLLLKSCAVFIAITLTFAVLTGCDFLSGKEKKQGKDGLSQIQLYGEVNCYCDPSFGSEILYTFDNGLSIDPISKTVRDDITWVKTEYGWIPLVGDNASVTVDAQIETMVIPDSSEDISGQTGFVTGVNLRVRSGPGAENEKVAELPTGTKVTLTEFYEASDGTWGKMEKGWIFMEHVYVPGTETQRHGYVVAKQATTIYDAILQPRNTVRSVVIGERLEIMHYITFDGDERWAYTSSGWIDLRCFYVEGETGSNPKSGIVQDTTPLNVRIGPGTQYQILSKLENGTFVSVMEQITCNSDTWGYTGEGWIAMSRVVEGQNKNQQIVGTWRYVERSTSEGVDIVTGDVWRFYNDGTYSHVSCGGYYYFDANGQLQNTPGYGMGSQEFSGTYTFNGSQVVLTCTYIEHESNAGLPSISTIKVRIDESVPCLYLGDSGERYYKVHNNESVQDIVDRYGI